MVFPGSIECNSLFLIITYKDLSFWKEKKIEFKILWFTWFSTQIQLSDFSRHQLFFFFFAKISKFSEQYVCSFLWPFPSSDLEYRFNVD